MIARLARYRRGLIAAAAAALVTVQSITAATRTEWIAAAAVAVLGAVATWLVPDLDPADGVWVKPAVAVLFAAAQAAVAVAVGGITGAEILTIAIQAIGAGLVLVFPNAPALPRPVSRAAG